MDVLMNAARRFYRGLSKYERDLVEQLAHDKALTPEYFVFYKMVDLTSEQREAALVDGELTSTFLFK